MSTYREPEEQDDLSVQNVNPLLDEPAIERHYTTPNINVSQEQLMSDIPEPDFVPPPMDMNATAAAAEKPKKPEPPKPINPALNEADKKDKNLASSHLAKIILGSYEDLHNFANQGVLIPEKRLNKLAAEGKIDLNINIPYELGKTAPAREVVQVMNDELGKTFTVSKEFKKEVTPVLERVLEKKGAGMTDEQMLVYLFGKDIATKGVMFYQMKQAQKELITVIAEATAAQGTSRAPQGQVVQPVAPPPSAPAPPPPPSQPPAAEDYSDFAPPPGSEFDGDSHLSDDEFDGDPGSEFVDFTEAPVTHASGNDYINDFEAQMIASKQATDVLRPQRLRQTVGAKGRGKKKAMPRAPQTTGKGTKGRPGKTVLPNLE